MDTAKLRKLRNTINALLQASEVMDEPMPKAERDMSAEEATAWKTSQRNRVLAGSGDKAEFLGTLSTEPVVSAADLEAMGVSKTDAAEMVAERDSLRAEALALTVAVEK